MVVGLRILWVMSAQIRARLSASSNERAVLAMSWFPALSSTRYVTLSASRGRRPWMMVPGTISSIASGLRN
jgi:hypothetical protein